MATVIERDRPIDRSERYVEVNRADTGGWVVAVVLLVLLAVGIVWWLRYHNPAPAAPSSGSANINVTVPGTSGGANGSASGGTGSGGSGSGAGTGGTPSGGTQYTQ